LALVSLWQPVNASSINSGKTFFIAPILVSPRLIVEPQNYYNQLFKNNATVRNGDIVKWN
ncbi:MAG: hypothetical protein SXA11_03505, partial [Cyanobacteriota bacterium]|nr:hypothetical protein [Cyanobacteriota bacterium]